MKKRLISALCLAGALVLLCLPLFASCSASPAASKASYGRADGIPNNAPAETEEYAKDGEKELPVETGQKLIKTLDMTLETTDFDAWQAKTAAALKEVGGYTERSNTEKYGVDALRTARMTLRVPQDKLDAFAEKLKGDANLLSFSESAEDVSLTYADVEGRLSALRSEQTALNAMLEKAEAISDIVSIRTRLTELRAEIESYESRLRVLSSKIEYSTVYITVNEVKTVTEPEKQLTFGQEVARRWKENTEGLGRYLRSFFAGLIGGLPTFAGVLITIACILVPPAAVAVIIVLSVRAGRKKKAAKREAEKAAAANKTRNDE